FRQRQRTKAPFPEPRRLRALAPSPQQVNGRLMGKFFSLNFQRFRNSGGNKQSPLQEIIPPARGCLAALLNRDRFLRLFNELLKAWIASQRIPERVQL